MKPLCGLIVLSSVYSSIMAHYCQTSGYMTGRVCEVPLLSESRITWKEIALCYLA